MKKKIAIVSTDWNESEYRRVNKKFGGVSYYRLVKPMEALKKEYDVDYFFSTKDASDGMGTTDFYNSFTKKYDMIIFKAIDNAEAIEPIIHWATHNKCIIVQDFDDNMLVIRSDQPAHRFGYKEGGQKRAYCAAMMSLVDAIIVSTQPLKDYFTKFSKEMFGHLDDYEERDIYVYPNFNDINDWNYFQTPKDKDKLIIGWMGSITHDSDLMMIMPTMGKILDKYDHVYFEILGGVLAGKLGSFTKGWSKKAKDKIKMKFGTPAWDKYPELIRSQPWDIGIAPLIDDEFNRGKSHIKWMEYAMCGIPTIASDVYPYTQNIPEGCGIISKNDRWEEHLSHLIETPVERKRLAKNALEYIKDKLQWSQHEEEYREIVRSIFKKHNKR